MRNKQPVPPTARTYESLTALLARTHPDGGTNISGALEVALESAERRFGQERTNYIDEIFFLSDGEPSGGIEDTDEILKIVRLANPNTSIRIHTVFIGDPGAPGIELLEKIAEENRGVFVRVD
jgi:uncharacterized protein with von Willebrand factor type A (vWA) domain